MFQIAKRLRQQSDVTITFFVPSFSKAIDTVIGDTFEVVKIPIPAEHRKEPFEVFSSQMERQFKQRKLDLIVHDGCPLRWASTMRWPDCPRIFVTNVFLTGQVTKKTFQNRWYSAQLGKRIANMRAEKGLPPIETVFDLYNADKVLLADPPALFSDVKGNLPNHFIFCGPVFWSAPKAIPKVLRALERYSLVSMGSTGKRAINDEFLTEIRAFTGSPALVYAGHQAPAMRSLKEIDKAFKFLPLNRIMENVEAVVTQGGAGSSYQALFHGAPTLAFPTHINQQILGRILEKAGLGICLGLDDSLSRLSEFDFENIQQNANAFAAQHMSKNSAGKAAKEILSNL